MPKASVILPLEQHYPIGPQAPTRQHFAEIFRHRAEIFSDHDAAVAVALLRDDAQQLLERKADIGTVGGPATVGGHKDTLEPENMIQSDRSGMPHRSAHQ